MPDRNLRLDVEGPVATLTLTRPERRNALSLELMRDFIACLQDLEDRKDVHALILAAEGNVFCSGHDLSEMTDRNLSDYQRTFEVCTDLMTLIQSIPQPVIARVQGVATAAGCQLVATCDLAVAAPQARFATPGVKIGLFCTTPMVALSRAIGRKRAMQMLLTGSFIDAVTAASWGLINEVVPEGELGARSLELAHQVSQASSFTVALGKQAFYAQIELDQAKAYAYAKEVMSMNAMAADAQEGISSFLEKRTPCWSER